MSDEFYNGEELGWFDPEPEDHDLIDYTLFYAPSAEELRQENINKLRRLVVKATKSVGYVVLATAVMLGAFGEATDHDPLSYEKYYFDQFFDRNCGPTQQWAKDTVEMETNHVVADSEMEQLRDDLVWDDIEGTPRRKGNYENALIDDTISIAREHNFHLVDYRVYEDSLASATSPAQVLSILNDFTHQYGVDTKFQTSNDDVYKVSKIAGVEVELQRFKQGAMKLMQAFFPIPIEVIKFSGVKQITIGDKIDGGKAAAQDETSGDGGKINIQVGSFYVGDPAIYRHEIYHAIDKRECGMFGTERDPEYKQLNPPDFHYKQNQNKKAYEGVTTEAYGSTALPEDKATMAQHILGQIDPYFLIDGQSEIITNKAKLELARLEQEIPGITAYFLQISPAKTGTDRRIDIINQQKNPG